MEKTKVYLDTSVISYLEQEDAPEKMEITREVWKLFQTGKYEIIISNVVLQEIEKCENSKKELLFQHLKEIESFYSIEIISNETLLIAQKFVDLRLLKQKSFDDCQHIACALVSGCDYIISWNFKHIVNVKTINGVKIIATSGNYKNLLIYPPTLFLESED